MSQANFYSEDGTPQLIVGATPYRLVRKHSINRSGDSPSGSGTFHTGYQGNFDAKRPVLVTTGAIIPVLEKIGSQWRFDVWGPDTRIVGDVYIFDAGNWANVTAGIKTFSEDGELTFSSTEKLLKVVSNLQFAVSTTGDRTREISSFNPGLPVGRKFGVLTAAPDVADLAWEIYAAALHQEPDGLMYCTRVRVPETTIYSLKPVPRVGHYYAVDITDV